MTLRLTLLAAIAAALAIPAFASAGGWATVGLDPPPDGLAVGEPWEAELTILQHGRAPLDGLRPEVIVRPDDGDVAKEKVFVARPAGKPGVYRANVTFDSPGVWRYFVNDDFAATHSFKPVRIGKGGAGDALAVASTAAAAPPSGGTTGGDDGPDYLLAILGAAVAALLAGGGVALLQRRTGGSGPAAG
jgi:hypothetical protein